MPINPTTLKSLIDTQITNETVNFAITPAEVGGRMKDTIDYTTEQIGAIELLQGPQGVQGTAGAQGAQGVQGPIGPLGPVGPAGLNWQGVWGDETAYFVDDAVSWNGASWFCILDTTLTVNPFPDEDTTHWALLASQGAQGAQGAQGPTGAQGPAGTPTFTEGSLNSNSQSIAENPAYTTGKITENFTRAYVSSSINNFLGLSNIGKDTGDFYVVQNKSTTLDLIVIPIDGTEFLQPNGVSAQVNFTIKPKTYARFTLADNDSGSAKTFMVEVINPLGENGDTQTSGFINLSATPQVLPYDINSCGFQGGKAFLPTTTEIGKQVYVFAAQDNIEIRANSANTNFMFVKFQTFIPSVTLLNKQMYLFTYIGFGSGAGGTVGGYWLAEEIKYGIGYLESSFKVSQNGTSNPMINNYYIDQISISPNDNTNPLFRSFAFNRVAVGQYNIQILWLTGSSSAINITKIDMSVGDGNIKLTSSSNGSFGPYTYFQQDINVYNAAGSLSDNEFYTNFYIRLFS